MPGMDGTGPMGMGPSTGWGRGRCSGYATYGRPDYFGGWGPGWGRGFGRGRGRRSGVGFGRGFGRGAGGRLWTGGPPSWGWGGKYPWMAPNKEAEVSWLRGEAEMLKADMEAVQHRIDELAAEEVT